MKQELIIIKQLPIIEEQLKIISEEIKTEIAKYDFNNLITTEENKSGLKTLRKYFGDKLKDLETRRKEVKKAINDPYEEFNKKYEALVSSPLKEVDNKLKTAIDTIEDEQKRIKTEDAKALFELSNKWDFLKFEDTGLRIGLSTTQKEIKETIEGLIAKVESDISAIDSMDNSERLKACYMNNLDLPLSISQVNAEIALEEKLKADKQEVAIEPVKEVIEEVKETPIMPIVEDKQEKIMKMEFTVHGTLTQLKALKDFMNREGIKYE